VTQTSERPPAPSPAGGGRGARRPRGNVADRVATYNRPVVAELRKVIWPTRNELVTYTIVTLVFVTAMVALVAFYDYVFTKGVLAIFG